MGRANLMQITIVSTAVGKNPLEEREQPSQSTRVRNTVLEFSFKGQSDLGLFPRQSFNITVIQVYAPTTDAKEAEANQFHEDLQYFLEHTKICLFILGGWNAKAES